MAPSFFSRLVKGSTTTSNAPTTDTKNEGQPRRSASRDRSSKPPKSRTPSSDTYSPRSSFQFGISTLTRAASRSRTTSSPSSNDNTDHPTASLHRKTESASAIPPVPSLPDNLKAAPATLPRSRRNSIISAVLGGDKNNDNLSIAPPQRPSIVAGNSNAEYDSDNDDEDARIPTIVTIASASRESVTTSSSSQLGVTIIPPSPLIYSSSLPSTYSSTSFQEFPAAVDQSSPSQEPELESVEQAAEGATTPTAGTTTTASVLVSLFGRRPRTSSISSAISGIIGYRAAKPSEIDVAAAKESDLGGVTAKPSPTTATTVKANPIFGQEPPLPPLSSPSKETMLTSSQTMNVGLGSERQVQRKISSRSLTNLPPPIIIPDFPSDLKPGAVHARAATYAEGETGTVTKTPIVDSPTADKTEFGLSPNSTTSSVSGRNRAASASASASGGFSSFLLSPKKGGDDDTASIISNTSKSPKDKDDKKRLFKRSTTRKPTGLASAIASSGLAMANPSISAVHSNQAVAAVQNASNNNTSNTKDSGVTSKGHPPGTVPYMSKSPSTSAVSAGQRSATTIASVRTPRSASSVGRKMSGARSPSSSSYAINSVGSRKQRRPSVSAYSDGASTGGLSAGRPGTVYYSGNESEGARSRTSRKSRNGLYSGNESESDGTDSGEDSSDDELLDGLDLDDEDMPVTGFAVASNKRNADFHELFSSIPEGDYLIEDYGCALQREILIQGRLYISENHICFHANIFGWITDLSIPIDEITTLEKKMTAFVIPNAIQITTRQARYTFASFLSRDTTYDVIYNIWRLARPDDIQSMRGSLDGAGGSGSAIYGTAEGNGGGANLNGTEGGGNAGAGGVVKKVQRRATQCACGREGRHFPETAMEATFPGSPEMIHNLMFASGFMKDFLAVGQKLTDIQMADWMPAKEGSNLLTRSMSYIKPLNAPMGPKQTKCEIKDEMEHVNLDDYISTVTTTRTPNVPSGGVFSVKTRTCIMWAGPVSTKVLVTTQVEWTGRSYIRGIIERSAIGGQKEYHLDLEKAMRAYIQEHHSEFVPEGVDVSELVSGEAAEVATAGAVANGPDTNGTDISPEQREKMREQERNQRAWQWAWDTFEDAFEVAKRSTKTALDLVSDAWDQSSSTTILYFVIAILVISNLYTLGRMGKKGVVGRRKEMMKADERERWVQSVVMTLWEELAAGKKEAVDLREEYLIQHGAAEHPAMALPTMPAEASMLPPSSLLLPGIPLPTLSDPPVLPGSWKEEVAHLHQTLEMVEERIKAIKQSLAQFEKLDGLD